MLCVLCERGQALTLLDTPGRRAIETPGVLADETIVAIETVAGVARIRDLGVTRERRIPHPVSVCDATGVATGESCNGKARCD